MGIFGLFKKEKSEVEQYYEERQKMKDDTHYDEVTGMNTAFYMEIEDVFSITGRGTVVTGRVKNNSISVGETVKLCRKDGSITETTITGIEMFRKIIDTAEKGDNVGVLLRGINRDEVASGDILRK